ncbi:acetyl esterase [Salsuginibacillus halophilus]|uniref:Acetyl esterase n=1 Tax=Salsuginibacillus halophilus TaxID=517424 RepID=A0A2P8HWQ7_9BACI|nr:alpha/beta hydrolase [Salsuginibacillus halophilus]PSL50595.1 acetyl esterase [Salsuginibacillus halophilus]
MKRLMKWISWGTLSILLTLVLAVEYWASTDEGTLPAKTAVILHAVNNNIVSLDFEPPELFDNHPFQTSSGNAGGGPMLINEHEQLETNDGYHVPLEIFRYNDAEDAPILVYFHGGAFLEGYGSLHTHQDLMRELAQRTGAVVVGVGYRVAPDHTFPTAAEDAYEGLKWAVNHAEALGGSEEDVIVAGDSAGGNLAAVTSMMARDRNGPEIAGQVLYYPLTTFEDAAFASRMEYDSGYYLLSRQVMEKARDAYTPQPEMWKNPYTSPLEADSFENLPPALILTAEYDPLRDEGELYAEKLHEAGVPVNTIRYEGVMHGFVSFFEVMESGQQGLQDTSQFVQRMTAEEPEHDEVFAIQSKSQPSGMERVREQAEAYAIAAFLIGRSAWNTFQE